MPFISLLTLLFLRLERDILFRIFLYLCSIDRELSIIFQVFLVQVMVLFKQDYQSIRTLVMVLRPMYFGEIPVCLSA